MFSTLTDAVTYAAAYTAPRIDWNISADLQDNARKAAFILALIWFAFIVGKFALPSKRSAMMQQGGGGGKYAGALFAILCLLDLNLIEKTINWTLKLIWKIGEVIGLV